MMTLKAYAVNEPEESLGAVVFAVDNIRARKIGAAEYNDGELAGMTCKRAPWADEYAATGVPASVMVDHGWHFECGGCGRRIDEDMASLAEWEDDVPAYYEGWTPDRMVGGQYGCFCTQECSDAHDAEEAQRKRVQDRAIERFRKIILRRFPGVEFVSDPERYRSSAHAYAYHKGNGWRVSQCSVPFTYPGAQYGPAELRCNRDGYLKADKKPHFTCAGGDVAVFEAWAKSINP